MSHKKNSFDVFSCKLLESCVSLQCNSICDPSCPIKQCAAQRCIFINSSLLGLFVFQMLVNFIKWELKPNKAVCCAKIISTISVYLDFLFFKSWSISPNNSSIRIWNYILKFQTFDILLWNQSFGAKFWQKIQNALFLPEKWSKINIACILGGVFLNSLSLWWLNKFFVSTMQLPLALFRKFLHQSFSLITKKGMIKEIRIVHRLFLVRISYCVGTCRLKQKQKQTKVFTNLLWGFVDSYNGSYSK